MSNLINTTNLVFFEIRVPQNTDNSAEIMSSFFQILPLPYNSIFKFLSHKTKAFAFELVCWHQKIYFLISIPSNYATYFKNQLIAQYPQILINEVGDFLPYFFDNKKEPLQQCSLGKIDFKQDYYYPFKTYKDFTDTDSMFDLLDTLSKTDPKHKILIQFLVSKAPKSWQEKGSNAAKITISTSEPGKVIQNPYRNLILQKISQTGLCVNIRILVTGKNSFDQEMVLADIINSFSTLNCDQGNSFKLDLPILKQDFLKKTLNRKPNFSSRFQILTPNELASIYHFPGKSLKNIVNISWRNSSENNTPENLPAAIDLTNEEKSQINFFAKTEFRNQEMVFGIKKNDRKKPVFITGKSGTGKSTLLANMVINDMRNDEGLAIIDPHGDLCKIVLDYIPENRVDDVIYFDLNNPETLLAINLFEVKNLQQSELLSSNLIAIFHKIFASSWGTKLEYILRNTILTLLNIQGVSFLDIARILTDDTFRFQIIKQLSDENLINFWTNEFNELDSQKVVLPIISKLEQISDIPSLNSILGNSNPNLDFDNIVNNKKILIVNLADNDIGKDILLILETIIITQIQLTAASQAPKSDFYLYLDECQDVLTNSLANIFTPTDQSMLNLTVACQSLPQIQEEVQKIIIDNVKTIICFSASQDDATILSQNFGETYKTSDLVKLNNYQIILKLFIDGKISSPFLATTLPLPFSKNQNREKIIQNSIKKCFYLREKSSKQDEIIDQIIPTLTDSEDLIPDIVSHNDQDQDFITDNKKDEINFQLDSASDRRAQAEEALHKLGIYQDPNYLKHQ